MAYNASISATGLLAQVSEEIGFRVYKVQG